MIALGVEAIAAIVVLVWVEWLHRTDWPAWGSALPAPTQFVVDFHLHISMFVLTVASVVALVLAPKLTRHRWMRMSLALLLPPLLAVAIAWTGFTSCLPYCSLHLGERGLWFCLEACSAR
ncbi:MAG: hypothetical protein ACYC8T_22605 [Myxococcaceae bacterium]